MSLTINFRVVGMYFGSSDPKSEKAISVTVENDTPSVAELMKQIAINVEARLYPKVPVDRFAFLPTNPSTTEDCTSITTNWFEGPISPSSGYQLPAGTYILEQVLNTNPESVLQYYIFDQDFQQINRNNKFISFGQPLDGSSAADGIILKDGYTIVWRLVGILSGPSGSSRAVSQARRALAYYKG